MTRFWQLAERECSACGHPIEDKTPSLSYGDKGYWIRCGECGSANNWASGEDYVTPDGGVA